MSSNPTQSAVLLAALLTASQAMAQQDASIPVHFPQGMHTTTVSGTLTGNTTANYTVEIETAQVIQLKLTASNTAALRVYAPDDDTTLNSNDGGQRFSGMLTTPGSYRIHVYQLPTQTLSNTVVRYTLSIAVR